MYLFWWFFVFFVFFFLFLLFFLFFFLLFFVLFFYFFCFFLFFFVFFLFFGFFLYFFCFLFFFCWLVFVCGLVGWKGCSTDFIECWSRGTEYSCKRTAQVRCLTLCWALWKFNNSVRFGRQTSRITAYDSFFLIGTQS